MRVFYFFHLLEFPFLQKSAEKLSEKYNLTDFCGFISGKEGWKRLEKAKFNISNIFLFSNYLVRRWEKQDPDIQFLKHKEQEYNIPNIWILIFSDRIISKFSRRKALRSAEIYIRCLEDAYREYKFNVIISDTPIQSFPDYFLYFMAIKKNIPFLSLTSSRIPGQFTIVHNPYDRWERVEEIFEKLKKRDLTFDEEKVAKDFLERFISKRVKPPYTKYVWKEPSVGMREVKKFFKHIWWYFIVEKGKNFTIPNPFCLLGEKLQIIRRHQLTKFGAFFEQPKEERFILYPLQYQPEASTLVQAPFYTNQISLIENIARSLPIDHILYVKEHRSSLGRRPLSYYRGIKSIPNIRLINPYIDSHKLIEKSSGIITITSTVGWEGLLYEKPIITFGEVFYNTFDLVYKIKDIRKLPEVVKRAISSYRPDKRLLLKLITAICKGTYEGEVGNPVADAALLKDENVEKVVKAIVHELALNKKRIVNI